ncbi:hypothetical protein V1478_012583 [Vespula squamosa]|uniref:Uncharacterized protein n=1 Tax=Vespula squamosa TaxID=30214 RepID=A0ABD2ADN0_VESSQ
MEDIQQSTLRNIVVRLHHILFPGEPLKFCAFSEEIFQTEPIHYFNDYRKPIEHYLADIDGNVLLDLCMHLSILLLDYSENYNVDNIFNSDLLELE